MFTLLTLLFFYGLCSISLVVYVVAHATDSVVNTMSASASIISNII